MGSKLAVLAAQLIAVAGVAHADPAADMKKGIEAYKAGRYDDATALLGKAYAADGKPETLFALAQAERLAGHCDVAVPHYQKLLEMTNDLNIAKLVETSLALCPAAPKPEPPKPPPRVEPVAPPPPPPPRTITVTRDVSHSDGLAITSFVAGGLALGAGLGLTLASSDLASAADHANTLDAYKTQHDRADRDRTFGLAAGGIGVALVAFGIVRLIRHDDPPKADVAVAPMTGGAAVSLSGRW